MELPPATAATMNPANLKKWLILVGVLYLIFPRDLVPDFAGRGLGLLDDALLLLLLNRFYRGRMREYAARSTQHAEGPDPRERSSQARAEQVEAARDPHEILGVDASASEEEIRAAYRARMQEYHPDKVSHLGEELQQVAHRKALEIQEAYEKLRE